MADATLRITKLNGGNYQTWKFKMELLLIKEDLWDVVSQDTPDPVTAAWETKDRKARATIGLLLEDSQLHLVRKETTAKATWSALKQYHEKSTLSNKVSLLKRLCTLKLTEGGNMETHLTQMDDLIDQLSSLGETLAQQLTVALLLSSLPDSFGTLITALETRPEADLTVELVKNKLIEEYKRRNENTAAATANDQQALKVSHSSTKPVDSTKTMNYQKQGLECFFCKKPNHMKKDCRKYIEWKKKNPDHKAKAARHCDEGVENPDEYACFRASETDSRNSWYVDSGASSHMCRDKNFFMELNEQHKGQIVIADGKKLMASGIGAGYLDCNHDDQFKRIKVTDVLYVPELKENLISVKRLTANKLKVVFEGESCQILKDSKPIAFAKQQNGLYELNLSERALMSSEANSCIHVWHNRFGHRDPNAIKSLEHQLDDFQMKPCQVKQVCECCIAAKMTRKPFPKQSESRSSEVLELIHTDVCGPMQTATPGGNRYFMTMIDDYSKYTVLYLLKNKSDVAAKIKEYVKFVQTKFERTPKVIRSDRGGEYVNEELKKFLQSEGIKAQLTAPFTPQQNGCSERKNRYLVEMTRSMLIDSKLPNKYWGEAVNTANYLQNILPTAGETKTPHEKWEGVRPKLAHIKRFGCQAYAVVPAERRQKLDCKARKYTFIGYADGTKGYRLLDTETDKICISRDVVFIEGDPHQCHAPPAASQPDDEQQEQQQTSNEVEINVETMPDHQHEQLNQPVPEPEIRRSSRTTRRPARLIETANVTTEIVEPKSFEDACKSEESTKWTEAMNTEIQSLLQNQTWSLTELPEGKSAIGSKWVYKIKTDDKGNPTRYKARLVAQGFSQKFGEQYDEVFAPVASPVTLRTLLTIAGHKKMIVKHYDIEAAYLNGDLSHEVYMKQPEGYNNGASNQVCKLNKSLYGLKQGANEWNKKLHKTLSSQSFEQSKNDPCLYIKRHKGQWMYLSIHVDDIITASSSSEMIKKFEDDMKKHFTMKDLGNLHNYLGIQIERDSDGLFTLHQRCYIERKLKEFNMSDCKPSNIPVDPGYQKQQVCSEKGVSKEIYRKAIGSLLYLVTNSRPDIAIGTSILARRVEDPRQADWTEVKRIFRYLQATMEKRLKLGSSSECDNNQLIGYADADWAGDTSDRKSNTGFVFKYRGAPIMWSSRKQSLVTLSTTEAEYIALSEAVKEGLWIKRILIDFGQNIVDPVLMFEDNQSCIKLIQDEKSSQRTKHIDTKFHFVRELFKAGDIDVKYCPTAEMPADLLTKPLEAVKLRQLSKIIGLE